MTSHFGYLFDFFHVIKIKKIKFYLKKKLLYIYIYYLTYIYNKNNNKRKDLK